ncbi:hypothetical protein WOLCODRAFT_104523 [Wolfiporia cocos MD-104 SS10]|uniref:Uncharacterized protein n=1 Tax=Wolfiporia cocos (strain MD-104) TaxID=742152 RepID=A0A2H3JQ67_WOLCO|nr:hypothetical protein WOLCODRAFT_104523 [Wolfiporia cocos MD-104 SS10]
MCGHLITCIRYSCAHQYPDGRHWLDCSRKSCRLSQVHNKMPHNCAAECTEIIFPDQHIVLPADVHSEQCDACLGIPPANVINRVQRGGHGY